METLQFKVNLDIVHSTLTVPKALALNKPEFGGTDEGVVQFVFTYLEG